MDKCAEYMVSLEFDLFPFMLFFQKLNLKVFREILQRNNMCTIWMLNCD